MEKLCYEQMEQSKSIFAFMAKINKRLSFPNESLLIFKRDIMF